MASAERLTVLFVLFFNLWISGKTEILATIFYTEYMFSQVNISPHPPPVQVVWFKIWANICGQHEGMD